MEADILNKITLQWGIITGFIFLVIIIPLRIYWRKKAMEKIKLSILDDEEIIYKLNFSSVNDYIVPFTCGAFLGSFILPFIFIKNITSIGLINKTNLPYFVLAEIICLLAVLYVASWEGVITNKKIRRSTAFLIFNIVGEKMNLLMDLNLDEIKSTLMEKFHLSKTIKISTTNNKIYRFGGYKEMDEIKLCIDNLLTT